MARKPKPAPKPAKIAKAVDDVPAEYPFEPLPAVKSLGNRDAKGQQAAFVPTQTQRAQVSAAVATFLPQEMIAKMLGIALSTLRKYFATEIETAGAHANSTVVGRLYEHTKKSPVACFYWLQNRAADEWQDKRNLNMKHEAVGSLADLVMGSYKVHAPQAPKPATNGHVPATNGHAKTNGHG